jgi:hypothetical protein
MKKLLALLALSACVAGCGTAAQKSELWEHETIYKNWDHMKFSWGGHKNVSQGEVIQSVQENWWGKETTVSVPMK